MLERWRRFRDNVPLIDAIRTIVFLPIFLLIFYFVFPTVEWLNICLALALSLVAPYFYHRWLTGRLLPTFIKVVNVMPVVWLVLLLVLQSTMKEQPEILVLYVAILGLYIGTYFWVFSAPGVYLVRRKR